MSERPLNYLVPDPNNPGAMMARYPVDSRATPGSSAHAYIDYLEGCLAEIRLRLEPLEQAHADLNSAFHRRALEFETRLDSHAQRLDGLETFLGPKSPY